MNELLSEFKTKLQANNVTDEDFAKAYNVIVGVMQRQRIATICGNETFFANLYKSYALLTMLQRGVPMHLWSTHEHALLYCYTLYGSASVFGNVGEPFGAVSRQGGSSNNALLVQDQDSDAIATTIGVAVECARGDNVFERTFDEMVIAVTSLVAEELLEERREERREEFSQELPKEQQLEQQVEQWQQQEWSQFTDSLQEYEQSFDCAQFFYNIFVNAPPGKKQQREKFDPKYQRLWKKIQSTATKEGAECVSLVAWLLCTEQPSSLALIRNRRADGSDGLLATMARCCERMQLLSSLRLAMDRRARQLLRRTTVKYTATANSSHIDLCVVPVQHVFTMGCAVLDWCRLVDASVGRLGEGAARLRCCFAQVELPMVGQDASMFFGLDRIPPTSVEWHASFDGSTTDTFTLYGRSRLAINVRTFATNAVSTVENAVATVQLLFGDRSSFDSILRCLYYGTRSNSPPSLDTLLEPLLLLSAAKCATKASELMHARRTIDRFGHIDAFHWQLPANLASTLSSSSTRFRSSSTSTCFHSSSASSSSVSSAPNCSSTNASNSLSKKRRNLFAEEEESEADDETINEDKLDNDSEDEDEYVDDKLVDEFNNSTDQYAESIRACWSINQDQVLVAYRYRHRLCDFATLAAKSATVAAVETCCDLYPWKTAKEFSLLQQLHGSRVLWQHLWTLSYEQLWLLSAASTAPPSKVEFEQRRLRFLEKYVKAMWSLNDDGNKYVVHLHSEWDEFDLLSINGNYGFIQFDSTVAPTFFNVANATRLMDNYWLSALYPWSTGEELIALLLHQQSYRQQQQQRNLPKQPVRRWQQLWSLAYENLWPQSYQCESHMSTFEPKRDRFLCRHVQAMWQLPKLKWFVAHLQGGANEETDPFERLSPSGFVCFPMSLDDSVFSNTGMTILMRNVSPDKYSWRKDSGGDEVLRIIQAASPPHKTVAMLKREIDNAKDSSTTESSTSTTESSTSTAKSSTSTTESSMSAAKSSTSAAKSSTSNQPPEKRRKNVADT